MKKKLLISSLFLIVAGWGLKPLVTSAFAKTPPAIAQVSNQSPNTTTVVQPQVELLNAGNAARQTLRFQPAINAKEMALMTVTTDMEMSVTGQPASKFKLPGSLMTIEAMATKIDANGDIQAQFKYADADVVSTTDTPEEALAAMRRIIKKLVGMKGSFIVDNRRQTKAFNVSLPRKIDADAKQIIEQISQSLNQLSLPLPEQAVGVGAKWRVSSPININGINMMQIATYQLLALQDGFAVFDVNIQQQAAAQQVNQSGAPKGATVTLQSYNSQRQGQITMRLDRLIPIRSKLSLRSNSQTSTTNDRTQEVTAIDTKLTMDLALESNQ